MRKQSFYLMCLLIGLFVNGCTSPGKAGEGSNPNDVVINTETVVNIDSPTATLLPTMVSIELEAEDALLSGNVKIESSKSGFSGTGYISGFEDDGDYCEFTLSIESDGFYDLNFISAALGGYKENYVLVDVDNVGVAVTDQNKFSDSKLERIFLANREHSVKLSKYWGWVVVDKLIVTSSVELDTSIYEVPATLVNQNASDRAKRLMSYLTDIYGNKFLSGQYCEKGMYGTEISAIWKTTEGKFPAVLGLDLIDYTPSRVEKGSSSKAIEYAIEFDEKGGIVTFCWHWNAPTKYLTGTWYRGFYKEETNIDLAKIMNGQDEEGYQLLMADIDAIAKELQKLKEADVPILWRPLHEASGGWFWWGAKGAEAYKKLYIVLYDKLTNEYGLNNLIWIWNGQDKEWYPGDEYVDLIGEDIYPGEKVYTSQINKYLGALKYTKAKKMIVLSENGCLFDPDLAIRDGAMWGFFATWGGEFVTKSALINWLSEQYTEEYMVKKVYAHDSVVTLDKLPDLKNYEVHE
ncbi:MAG TPA: beta-mannosidase [Lachnoclostridium phytofermentans]|uniref:Beta-mannosidase n=1 Tax=Lachnoclostridium phytofermentans TaxID=66219 RepID=A0A3D2X3D5_9FIRM|nr:beta-mannosidase [Lachnoclostridium phytofermentans]